MPQDLRDFPESRESGEHLEREAPLDLRDVQENEERKELAVRQVPKVHEERPDRKVEKECVGHRDPRDCRVHEVLRDREDHKERWDPQV